jgi:hypothetical protein
MARTPIQAPATRPPAYGLIVAAPTVETPATAWGAGWEFNREQCAGGGRTGTNCRGGNPERTVDTETDDELVEGDPFLVWAERHCRTIGFAAGEFEARARRQLAAIESYELANELWTGTLTSDSQEPANGMREMANRALVDVGSDTVTDGEVEPVEALGRLVRGLDECSHGTVGMIHVTSQVLVALVAASAVYRDGSKWYTPMGHIVVADAGYDGSGPGGAPAGVTQWAYATSLISVRLAPVSVPASFDDSVDHRTNRVVVYAERLVGYQSEWCCHLAAEIDLPVPLIGAPS